MHVTSSLRECSEISSAPEILETPRAAAGQRAKRAGNPGLPCLNFAQLVGGAHARRLPHHVPRVWIRSFAGLTLIDVSDTLAPGSAGGCLFMRGFSIHSPILNASEARNRRIELTLAGGRLDTIFTLRVPPTGAPEPRSTIHICVHSGDALAGDIQMPVLPLKSALQRTRAAQQRAAGPGVGENEVR